MWSRTKKLMEDRLADCLKDRVMYTYDVFDTKHNKHWTRMDVFNIWVKSPDKTVKEKWFATNPNHYKAVCDEMKKINPDIQFSSDEYAAAYKKATLLAIKNTGLVSWYNVPSFLHLYLNVLSIDECLSGDNYFLYLLAILDKRTGKRRIKKLYENLDNEPEWIRRFIILRSEGEGIIKTKA